MRKYREIARVFLKSQLAWRADVVFNMIFTVSRILFASLLWGIIFARKEVIAGFSFHGMLSYYIISSFLSQLEMSEGISGEVSARIRNGTFSKYMILPVSIEGYFAAMEAGVALFYLGFDLAAALVWVFVFRIEFTLTADALIWLCSLCMILTGLIFMVQLNYYLGILALKYQGIDTFLMIKSHFVELVTGSIIPLVLLPEGALKVMKLLPFYYVTYLPSMLLTGRLAGEALPGLGILAGWCVGMQVLIRLTWSRYSRKYDGVGI